MIEKKSQGRIIIVHLKSLDGVLFTRTFYGE